MTIHADVGFKGAQQVLKILPRKDESPLRVVKGQENRMLDFAGVACTEHLTPFREFFEPALNSRLIGNVVSVSSEGIDGGKRITLVAWNKVRRHREVLIMTARQAAALSIRSPNSWVGIIHARFGLPR